MDATFSITVDAATSLVRIVMSGFFNQADIDRFVKARDAAHQELRCALNQHATVVDITRMCIQSQASVEAFAHVLSEPQVKSRAIAFVVARSLARAQINRAAAGRDAMFFNSLEDAEQWLSSDDVAVTHRSKFSLESARTISGSLQLRAEAR